MHKVIITSMSLETTPVVRFEVRLKDYDIDLQRKLNLMGYKHFVRGVYVKELRNPDEMKERYLFNMDFLQRKFGNENIKYYKYQAFAS